MRQWIVVIAALVLAVFLVRNCFTEGDTPEGQRADSVLAERPAWEDTVRRQNLAIDSLSAVIGRQADSLVRAGERAAKAERAGRSAIADAERADSTAEESLDAMRAARDQWRGAALHYAQVVVPAFQQQVAAAARLQLVTEEQRDSALTQRDEARRREAKTARSLADLRSATKPGAPELLGLRIPAWADEAVLVAGAGVLGYAVGK